MTTSIPLGNKIQPYDTYPPTKSKNYDHGYWHERAGHTLNLKDFHQHPRYLDILQWSIIPDGMIIVTNIVDLSHRPTKDEDKS